MPIMRVRGFAGNVEFLDFTGFEGSCPTPKTDAKCTNKKGVCIDPCNTAKCKAIGGTYCASCLCSGTPTNVCCIGGKKPAATPPALHIACQPVDPSFPTLGSHLSIPMGTNHGIKKGMTGILNGIWSFSITSAVKDTSWSQIPTTCDQVPAGSKIAWLGGDPGGDVDPTPPPQADPDQGCHAKGGQCKDHAYQVCGKSYTIKGGLCSGSADRKCCIPWTPPPPKDPWKPPNGGNGNGGPPQNGGKSPDAAAGAGALMGALIAGGLLLVLS